MLSRGMRDKPIEISQGSLGSLRVAVPSPFPKVVGGRVRLSTEHCQSFFINATSKLVTKLQAIRARDLLIQQFCMRFFGFDPIFFRFFCFG